MNTTRSVFMMMLVMIAGLVGGAMFSRFFAVVPAQAQRVDRSRGAVPNKWEYCSITKAAVGPSRGGLHWISYFRDTGV